VGIRETILASAHPKPKAVEVAEWGTIYIRTLTVGEILEQQTDVKDGENRPAIARALCRVLCDEQGQRVFDPAQASDVDSVLALPWLLVRNVMEAANEHNGLVVTGKA